MKIYWKTLTIFILLFFLSMIYIKQTTAVETINPDDFNPSTQGISTNDKNEIKEKTGVILGWLRNLSVTTSVIAIMVIGYKYIVGSVEEKAEYKKTLIPLIIGCVMAISGTSIVSFIYNNS